MPLPADHRFAALSATLTGSIRRRPWLAKRPAVRGLTLVIIGREGVLYRRACGEHAGHEQLPIASATKLASAAAILRLVDSGRVDLDAPIAEVLPVAREAAAGRASLRMLLSHTSGLPGLRHTPRSLRHHGRGMSLQLCARKILSRELRADPGTRFSYGGAGYQLAGALVEAVSGQSWGEYFRRTIAEPCGLRHFNYNGGRPNPRIGGGGVSDADDMARLLAMLLAKGVTGNVDGGRARRRVLSEAVITEMERQQVPSGIPVGSSPLAMPPHGYGLGWWLTPQGKGQPALCSAPGLLGAVAWLDREHGYAAFLLTTDGLCSGLSLQRRLHPMIVAALS